MENLIVCVAPVGYWGKGDNNPLTPTEIAEETYRCYQQGASMVHLHLRDEFGNATTNTKAFEETVNLIRKRCDIIIQAPIGDSSLVDAGKRSVVLNVPQIQVSALTTGSHNIFNVAAVNTFDDIEYWLKIMQEKDIIPEINVFELGMVDNVKAFINKGLLKEGKYYYSFCLGFPGCMHTSMQNLSLLVNSIEKDTPWFYSEFGNQSFIPVTKAISFGGNVIVGFDANIFLEPAVKARSNELLVKKSIQISKELGRKVASVQDAHKILGIEK